MLKFLGRASSVPAGMNHQGIPCRPHKGAGPHGAVFPGLCTLLWCPVGAKLLEKESCSSAGGLGAGDEQVELAGGTGGNEQR